VSDEALLKQVGRVLRLWKEQERKLVAEKAALAEELDALRKSSSAAGATSALSSLSSSSSAELAQMRLACSAAQKELAAVTAELRALQTSAGPSSTDIADLQEQLENQKALASSLGEELNSVSEAAEAAQQRLVHLGSVATFEGTKVLDKLRAERVQNQRQLAAMRTEQTGLRATNERLEQTLAAQNRALASLRQEADNLTARTSSAREIEGALQSSVDKLRSAAAQAASEALDARTKMQQISERHDACGGIMAAMEKKQQEGTSL
jgi:chromosome segregation ATPase